MLLSESKIEQRVMVEANENSTDVFKRTDDRRIFAEIAPNKNIMDNRKFRKKRSKTYADALQSVGKSNSGGEVLETRKAPNVLKEENHDFNRTVGINLESIYARLREDELLGSDNYPLHLDFAQTHLLLKIHLGIEMCLQTLMERIMRF